MTELVALLVLIPFVLMVLWIASAVVLLFWAISPIFTVALAFIGGTILMGAING